MPRAWGVTGQAQCSLGSLRQTQPSPAFSQVDNTGGLILGILGLRVSRGPWSPIVLSRVVVAVGVGVGWGELSAEAEVGGEGVNGFLLYYFFLLQW